MTVRVLGWAADRVGSGYWRIGLPLRVLRESGGLNTVSGESLAALDPAPGDVIVTQRVASPEMAAVWRRLRDAGLRRVIDVDDDYWAVDRGNAVPFEYWTGERLALFEQQLREADLVIAATAPLAERVGAFADRVRVIPNRIDAALLDHVRPQAARATIGWAGSPTHADDLAVAAPALRAVLRGRPTAELHLAGPDYSGVVGVPARQLRLTPWFDDIGAYQRALDFDIGIAPLADTTFNRAKSALKVLEYAALGIPVVASAVGPYRSFVKHGVTGFLASSTADWRRHLSVLLDDPALRAAVGAAARLQAAEHTVQAGLGEWAAAFASVSPELAP